jgi:periplasmic nitrate reductase NapD
VGREHHISSLLVHARPDRAAAAQAAIGAIDGAEIHAVSPAGKLIVTLENSGTGAISDALSAINSIDGVLSAVLVYHQFEPATGEE